MRPRRQLCEHLCAVACRNFDAGEKLDDFLGQLDDGYDGSSFSDHAVRNEAGRPSLPGVLDGRNGDNTMMQKLRNDELRPGPPEPKVKAAMGDKVTEGGRR